MFAAPCDVRAWKWLCGALLLGSGFCHGVDLIEQFNTLDNWFLAGNPRPSIDPTVGRPPGSFNPGGGTNGNGKAITRFPVNITGGKRFKANIQIPVLRRKDCSAWFGLAASADSNRQFGLAAGFFARSGVSSVQLYLNNAQVSEVPLSDTKWHAYVFEILDTGLVRYLVDGAEVFVSATPLDVQFNNLPVTVGGRSAGGAARVDSIRVSGLNPLNLPPVAVPQSLAMPSESATAIALSGADAEDQPLTFAITANPANGTLSGFDAATGAARYTPNTGFGGQDAFSFTVNDGTSTSASAAVSLNVSGQVLLDEPFDNLNAWTLSGTPPPALDAATGSPAGSLDPGGGSASGEGLSKTTFDLAAGLRIEGQLRVPVLNAVGCESWFGLSASAASDARLNLAAGFLAQSAGAQLNLFVNDVVVRAMPLRDTEFHRYTLEIQTNGIVVFFMDGFGVFTSASALNAALYNNMPLSVGGRSAGGAARVDTLRVTRPGTSNQPPVANAQSATTLESTPTALTLTGSDPESAALTFVLLSSPGHGQISAFNAANGTLLYTPDTGYIGPDEFSFYVSDGTYVSAPATLSLTVNSSTGAAGGGLVDDNELASTKSTFSVSWSKHAAGENADKLALSGYLNTTGFPVGADGDIALNGVTVQVIVNGVALAPAQPLDEKGKFSSASDAAPRLKYTLKGGTGKFSFTLSATDLRTVLGLSDLTEERTVTAELKVAIGGTATSAATTVVLGSFDYAYSSKAGSTGKGAFKYTAQRMAAGAFKSTKTAVAQKFEQEELTAYEVSVSGLFTAPASTAVIPAADSEVTVTLGSGDATVVISIPFASLARSGDLDEKSVFTYKESLGAVEGLKKFTFSNSKRTFSLQTGELAALAGIPSSGDRTVLPVKIEIQTAAGTFVFETTVEIQRASATSTSFVLRS